MVTPAIVWPDHKTPNPRQPRIVAKADSPEYRPICPSCNSSILVLAVWQGGNGGLHQCKYLPIRRQAKRQRARMSPSVQAHTKLEPWSPTATRHPKETVDATQFRAPALSAVSQ